MCFGWTRFKRHPLLVTQAREVTIFMAIPALVLSCMTLEPFYILGNFPHLWHLSLLLCVWLGSNLFLYDGPSFLCSLEYLFWLFDLGLWECCFYLLLLGGRSVLWCLKRLTWAPCGSTCNFFDMSGSGLWGLHFLGKLPHLACWETFPDQYWNHLWF